MTHILVFELPRSRRVHHPCPARRTRDLSTVFTQNQDIILRQPLKSRAHQQLNLPHRPKVMQVAVDYAAINYVC